MADIKIEDEPFERGKRGHRGRDGATGPTGPTGPGGSASSRTAAISSQSGSSSTLPVSIGSSGVLLAGSQIWWVPITVEVGEQLDALTFYVFGDGAVDVDWAIFHYDYATDTQTVVASGTVVNVPAAWTPTTPVFAAVPVDASQALIFFFQPNAGGAVAGGIFAAISPQ